MNKRVPRRLTERERTLWAQVTRALTPLQRPSSAVETSTPASPPPDAHPKPPQPPGRTGPPPRPAVADAKPAPVPRLNRRLKQRLGRGRIAIDACIDLHGLTQAEAFGQLTAFLRRARREGARIVLVITGKGVMGAGDGRGVLRRQVPLWLSSAGLREGVIAFAPAHAEHGGSGALYVRLRRGEP